MCLGSVCICTRRGIQQDDGAEDKANKDRFGAVGKYMRILLQEKKKRNLSSSNLTHLAALSNPTIAPVKT